MAREDVQGFKRYVKEGWGGAGMLFPGIRIRVDQDEESGVEERQSRYNAMERRVRANALSFMGPKISKKLKRKTGGKMRRCISECNTAKKCVHM